MISYWRCEPKSKVHASVAFFFIFLKRLMRGEIQILCHIYIQDTQFFQVFSINTAIFLLPFVTELNLFLFFHSTVQTIFSWLTLLHQYLSSARKPLQYSQKTILLCVIVFDSKMPSASRHGPNIFFWVILNSRAESFWYSL